MSNSLNHGQGRRNENSSRVFEIHWIQIKGGMFSELFSSFPVSYFGGTEPLLYWTSTLDKQRICVNTHLKSLKKQLKSNVCVPKSNSNKRYAITCNVIAYHLVHFISIWVINKCQSGIDFFLLASNNITPVL